MICLQTLVKSGKQFSKEFETKLEEIYECPKTEVIDAINKADEDILPQNKTVYQAHRNV